MPLRSTTSYSPWKSGCSSLIRSMFTMAVRWMRMKRAGSSFASIPLIVSRSRWHSLADVKADVVPRGLDPVDLFGAQEEQPPGRLDDEPLEVALGCLQVLEQGEQPLARRRRASGLHGLARPVQGLLEALLVEGLEQVVHRVDLEGLEGVLVVGRDEDDDRHPVVRRRAR